jgi:pilus assembly protein FimV
MPMENPCRLILLLALIAPFASHAVTLGQARVNSFLGQPLDAEIDLIGVQPGQHEDLRLRLANQQHFERLGIPYERHLAALEFDVVRSGSQWLVRARTRVAITEPFIDFPLQMTWPGGQMIRQYTLLLDPPRRVRPARISGNSPTQAAAEARRTADDAAAGMRYGPVQPGETLWPIAQRLKPGGITTRQMAIALLRANPQAFVDNDINRLRAGSTLTIPARSFIEEIDPAAARAEFDAQINRQRRKTPAIATSPRELQGAADPAPARADRTSGAAPAVAADAHDDSANAQLRIIADQRDGEETEQALREQLLVTMEEIESNRLTTGAIESRLARLESELEHMQRLVELKDAQIAALQSEVADQDAQPALAPATAQTAPEPTVQGPVEVQPAETATAAAPGAPEPEAAAPTIKVEALTPMADAQQPAPPAWHEEYLWAIWSVLALLGLVVVLLMFRRSSPARDDIPMAEMPEVRNARRPYAAAGNRLHPTREHVAGLPSERAQSPQAITLTDAGLTDPGDPSTIPTHAVVDDGLTGSLTDNIVDDDRRSTDRPQAGDTAADYSDEDIASWIEELGAEHRGPGMNGQSERDDADVPSLLTELDDRLASAAPAGPPASSGAVPPADEVEGEDETFAMSLDLARAYLEIGDHDGARDMLEQALSGARSPEHQRQIEELLRQID